MGMNAKIVIRGESGDYPLYVSPYHEGEGGAFDRRKDYQLNAIFDSRFDPLSFSIEDESRLEDLETEIKPEHIWKWRLLAAHRALESDQADSEYGSCECFPHWDIIALRAVEDAYYSGKKLVYISY